MGLVILFVGRTKEGFVRDGTDKYLGYVKRYTPVELRETKGVAGGDPKAAVEKEADLVLGRLRPTDRLVLLDEHGESLDTARFAGMLKGMLEAGGDTVFVAGGPYGNSGRLKKRAEKLLSLSRLTYTHEMARLILAEQVYRAFTIIKGKTYHY